MYCMTFEMKEEKVEMEVPIQLKGDGGGSREGKERRGGHDRRLGYHWRQVVVGHREREEEG